MEILCENNRLFSSVCLFFPVFLCVFGVNEAPCFPYFIPYSTAEIEMHTSNLNINTVISVLSWSTFLKDCLMKSRAREFSILELSVWIRQYYMLHPNHEHRISFSTVSISASLPESCSLTQTSLQKLDTVRIFVYYAIITFFFKSFLLTTVYCEMESADWLGFSPINC